MASFVPDAQAPTPVLDPERQKRAREYARINRRLWLVDMLLTGLYTLLWLVAGWSVALTNWLERFSNNPWFLVAGFAAVFGGLLYVLSLPMSCYTGFVLPHRFDQSTQTLKGWIMDQAKFLLIGAPLGLIMLELLYLALRVTGEAWWLWATAGLLIFSVLLGNLAPVLLMPLFNKYTPLGEEHSDLVQRLIRLAEKAHTHVRGVYKFDLSRRTRAANAALTGMGNTRRIILGDTLIDEFTPDEIETVLAHELGHHVHGDIPLLITIGTVTTALGLYVASLAMDWAVTAFGLTSVADPAGLPALMLILGAYGLLTMPIENGFSRWRERMADEYALSATGKNEAFASAFTRLANQNLADAEPEPWVVWLFYDHPPLGERIEMAHEWKPT
jgi:STE24 endopeptidase